MDWNNIRLSDKALFDDYFHRYPPLASEFTFTNLFAWDKYEFSEYKGHLLIRSKEGLLQPIGPHPEKTIAEFNGPTFVRVAKGVAEKTGLPVSPQEEHFDYVYLRSDLAELPGNRYRSKKNFINRFENNDPQVCSLSDNEVKEFLKLNDEWCRLRNCHEDKSMSEENMAVRRILENHRELGVIGTCVSIGGKLVAFALGEPLNKDTYVEHIEKANTFYPGAYQYLLREFAKSVPDSFMFINREQDLGVEGLRNAKKSYFPVHMAEKYKIGSVR